MIPNIDTKRKFHLFFIIDFKLHAYSYKTMVVGFIKTYSFIENLKITEHVTSHGNVN